MTYRESASARPSWSPATRRETLLTIGINPGHQIGLEIGAANNPIIPAAVGSCRYVDYMSRTDLMDRLKDYPYKDSLVYVDYIWSGSGSLIDKIGDERFDYAIASHVIEHVPNPIGWFKGIAEALKPGAHFTLAIPDRRFTFDFAVPESTVGQLVEAHLLNYERPSPRQVFETCFYGKAIEPSERWSREFDPQDVPAYTGDIAPRLAYDQACRSLEGMYYDSHCWVVTPSSFLELMKGVCQLGLMPFEFVDYHPTVDGEFEFFAVLKKPADHPSGIDLINRQLDQIKFFSKVLEESRRRLLMLAE